MNTIMPGPANKQHTINQSINQTLGVKKNIFDIFFSLIKLGELRNVVLEENGEDKIVRESN